MDFEDQPAAGIEGGSFQALLKRRAPRSDFFKWFAAFSQPKGLTGASWLELVPPLARAVRDLGWMTEPDRGLISGCILDFVLRAFTDMWRPEEHSSAVVHEALGDFMTWVQSLPDYTVVRFCWDLVAYDRTFTPEPVWWLKRCGRLSGTISYDHIGLAVSLADEADAMLWWPRSRWSVIAWDAGSAPYIELLGHESYLVRSAASLALGRLFKGIRTNVPGRKSPSLSEILTMIQHREVETPGVAGAFLNGADWSVDPEAWATFGGDFDMNAWIIETLRNSALEPQVPHIQSLEFYAHELFAYDGNAIREFLKMGRKHLAVMTATEEPSSIPDLLPVLTEIAGSDDPALAAVITEYLSSGSHHAGLRHLEKCDAEREK